MRFVESGGSSADSIPGFGGSDHLDGNAGSLARRPNGIDGYAGDDLIRGRQGDDRLNGGTAADTDTIYGGDGNDYCLYGETYSRCQPTFPVG